MLDILLWYVLLLAVGWLAFPIAFRLLKDLPDRGFALAKPLGLLLWGFAFWLLASLHVVGNDTGGVLFALLLIAGLSALISRGQWGEMLDWISANRKVILTVEVLFLAAFGLWTYVRSGYPDVTGTEKPMEMAFINAILRSPTFPPRDPWLAGYSISYYYFGYVMIAMLIRMTGTLPGVAFNLASALWFALTAVSAYGIVFNLLARRQGQKAKDGEVRVGGALLGPLFVLLFGNMAGLLEVMHSAGWFWKQDSAGLWQSKFWRWLDIQELVNPPTPPFTGMPERNGGIWWWRASRVLQDYDLAGASKEVIDEFPFFSYLLADLHPHVLAMPFVLLAVGLAMNYFFRADGFQFRGESLPRWLLRWVYKEETKIGELALFQWARQAEFWLVVLTMGGLAFLNTWDFPIYVGLYAVVVVLKRMKQDGWSMELFWLLMRIGITLGVLGVAVYLPFYVGFSSQAGGFLPSLAYFTRGVHLWVMFGTLLVPICAYLLWLWYQAGSRKQLRNGLKMAGALIGGLWLFSFMLAGAMLWMPRLAPNSPGLQSGANLLMSLQGGGDGGMILLGALARRLAQPGAWLTLLALVTLIWALILRFCEIKDAGMEEKNILRSTDGFVLVMLLLGVGLVVFPEFIYLRDQFSTRMNTIFKFYFQTWILWGMAAAYGAVVLFDALKKSWKVLWTVALVVWVGLGLIYPFFGMKSQTGDFRLKDLSLDGTAYIGNYAPDDLEAISWLRQAPDGVIVEAVGGSYSGYARMATHSGLPNVLGWPGHESQWRGGGTEMGSRETDIETIYQSSRWGDTQILLTRYNVRYVVIGNMERGKYRVYDEKFIQHLVPVFSEGNTVIYEVPDYLSAPIVPEQ